MFSRKYTLFIRKKISIFIFILYILYFNGIDFLRNFIEKIIQTYKKKFNE